MSTPTESAAATGPGEAAAPTAAAPALDSLARRTVIGVVAALAFWLATFVPARTLRWPGGWLGLALVIGGLLWQDAYVRRRNPGLMERRRRAGAGTPWWDRALMGFGQLCTFAIFVVGGLEGARRHPGFVPLPLWLGGLGLWALGQGLVAWAMSANAFFEGTIRLQSDVAHQVVSAGPYRYVRHPGYAGILVYSASLPLLFGAVHAFIPAALVLGWLLPRTILEDRFLRAQLPGYADYAGRVRWRWVPGVW